MEGRAEGRERKDWKVNLEQKTENQRVQETRGRSAGGNNGCEYDKQQHG